LASSDFHSAILATPAVVRLLSDLQGAYIPPPSPFVAYALVMSLGYFVINLKSRSDRLSSFLSQFSGLDFTPEVVDAVDAKNLESSHLSPNVVAACWLSHQKVSQSFLNSSYTHAMVFEDDACIDSTAIDILKHLSSSDLSSIDVLQLGYLTFNGELADRSNYRLDQFLSNIEYTVAQVLHTFGFVRLLSNKSIFHNGWQSVKLKREVGLKLNCIADVFEWGTHAFIISRKAAVIISNFNNPVVLPADLAMMEVSRFPEMRSWKLAKSIIPQSDSPSSIPQRSTNPLGLLIEELVVKNSPFIQEPNS
jgi:GR25 family glycosyltransferase involved in LPS biosynthesis